MNAKDITKELKKVGGVKRIATECGVAPPTVSQVIHRVRRTNRIRQSIAAAVNKPVADLWPEEED
jgi:DNA-binding transcriptional regulator YdaS (Cro superfamily)